MLILSRVCAEFRNRKGTIVHRVTPDTRLTFQEAPEAIREDPLFQMLVDEGSLEAAVTPVKKRKLENEPMDGADASGKKPSAPDEAQKELTNPPKKDMIKGKNKE